MGSSVRFKFLAIVPFEIRVLSVRLISECLVSTNVQFQCQMLDKKAMSGVAKNSFMGATLGPSCDAGVPLTNIPSRHWEY